MPGKSGAVTVKVPTCWPCVDRRTQRTVVVHRHLHARTRVDLERDRDGRLHGERHSLVAAAEDISIGDRCRRA